jgi:hypothetical protein
MNGSPKTYRENRSRFSVEELRRYDGQWAAFSPDGRQIVASDSSLTGLLEALQAAGTDPQTVVLERIELETGDAFVGGADQQ